MCAGMKNPGSFVFTNAENHIIMIMPNKLNKQGKGMLYLYGDSIPFFWQASFYEFGKNANSIKEALCGSVSPSCLSLFGDNRGLRFSVR